MTTTKEKAIIDAAKALVRHWQTGGDGRGCPPPGDRARRLYKAVKAAEE